MSERSPPLYCRGTGLPNPSCETELSGTNGDRIIFIFPVRLTTSRIDNLTQLTLITLAICDDHTYVHTHHRLRKYFVYSRDCCNKNTVLWNGALWRNNQGYLPFKHNQRVRCQTFSFSFFPCSADHERDWPPCKEVFFGLATNALNVRNNNTF